jgi:hypothetical protein
MGASAFQFGFQDQEGRQAKKKSRQEQLQDEQRNQKLSVYTDLFHNDRISPAELAHAVEDVYHDAEPDKKMTIFGRILNHKKAKQQAADAAKGKQTRATDESGILAGAKQPGQAEQEQTQANVKAVQDILTNPNLSEDAKRTLASLYGAKNTNPTGDALKRQDYQAQLTAGTVPVDPTTKQPFTYEAWLANQGAAGRTAGSPPKKKSLPDQYEDAYRKQYGLGTDEPLTLKDLGYVNELMAYDRNHGTSSIVTHLEKQPDGTMLPVTVFNTSGMKGAPKSPRDTGAETPKGNGKQPAPKKATGGTGNSRVNVGTPFGQSKADAGTTPGQVKAKKDYEEAVGLSDLAKSVASKPDDALNQKRLLVQLERQSAGRFTVQALDYVKQAGWGNTLEEWANKPNTGALPKDILRQIVDGANENLHSKKAALDAANQIEGSPGPRASGPKEKKNAAGDTIVQGPDGKWSLKSAATN